MVQKAHQECINTSNPYHECTSYCIDVEAKLREAKAAEAVPAAEAETNAAEEVNSKQEVDVDNVDESNLDEIQKKFRLLKRKADEARKANQSAVIAENKRLLAPNEERGVSKQKWFNQKMKNAEKRLEISGLDKSKSYMLETEEAAEAKYEKQKKRPAPFGWDVFNERSLYRAYKRRTRNIQYTVEYYIKTRDADPDFYRDNNSLQYGTAPVIPEENVDKMVNELLERKSQREQFSRRRRHNEEKFVDSINARNEHFNKKAERAFGKYTVEIKNSLERGTALPD